MQSSSMERRSFVRLAAAAGAAAVLPGVALADEAAADDESAPADGEASAESESDSASADGEASAAAAAQPTVYVIDRYEVSPGDGEAFVADYLATYAPMAQACGAELVSALVAPPVWLPMDSNVVTFTWKVAGILGCWGIDSPLRGDPDATAWWEQVHGRVVSMDRSYASAPEDMEVLCNV